MLWLRWAAAIRQHAFRAWCAPEEIAGVSLYAAERGIEPRETGIDCPWLAKNRMCAVYEARPAICRAYHCVRGLAGRMPGKASDYHVYNTEAVFLRGDLTRYDGLLAFAEWMGAGGFHDLFNDGEV